MSATAAYFVTPQGTPLTFTSADTTTAKSLLTAGASGARLDSINVCSDDSAAITLQLYNRVGGTNYLIGEFTIPAGSGIAAVVPVEILTAAKMPLLDNANLGGSVLLKAAENWYAACKATMTAAKTMTIQPRFVDA